MKKCFRDSIRRILKEQLRLIAPEFKAVCFKEKAEWHPKVEPIYCWKASDKVWLFISFVPISNREIVWCNLGWTTEGKLPVTVRYFKEADPYTGSYEIRLLDPLVGKPYSLGDDIDAIRLSCPDDIYRDKAIEALFSPEGGGTETIRHEWEREMAKTKNPDSVVGWEEYLRQSKQTHWRLYDTWDLVCSFTPIDQAVVDNVAQEVVDRCCQYLEQYGLPFLRNLAAKLVNP